MSIVGNLRLRYVFGLTAIAVLVTTSFFTMQHLISKQRGFSQLINLAGHQAGLTNRIAYFASLMAATDDELNMEFRVIRPDGSERLVYHQATSVEGADGRVLKISGIIHDITERKELSNRLDKLSRHIPGFIFQYKRDSKKNGCMPYVSGGVEQTLGIRADVLQDGARAFLDFIYEEDLQKVLDSIDVSAISLRTWKAQFRVRHPEKGEVWLEGHATPERLMDAGTLWYGYIWDITERQQAENRIRRLALYDALTGLANRRMFMDRLAHAVALSGRKKEYGAVLMLDLDDFGTGYSSLNSIKNLPLTALKIDASLIRGIEEDESSRAIVRAALAMARAMSLQTIAEGVETKSQMDYLVAEECDIMQGYLFAKPMPYEEFISYLGRRLKIA